MTNEQIGMVLSLCGMVVNVLSYQVKHKLPLMVLQTVGSTLFLISYAFSGGGIGVVLNALMLARNFLVIFYKPKTKTQLYVFCGGLFASYIITYVAYTVVANEGLINNVWNAFPILAAIFGTIAFMYSNVNMLRVWKYGDSICWLTYNMRIGIGVLGGIIGEVLNLISLTVGIIRFRDKKQKGTNTT